MRVVIEFTEMLMDAEGVAEFLQLSVRQVKDRLNAGVIYGVYFGSRRGWRVLLSEVLRYLAKPEAGDKVMEVEHGKT